MKFKLLLSMLRPFAGIARELKIIRELMEADLASRHIYRVTEKPSKKDTEITYAGVTDDRPLFKRWFDVDDVEEDDVLS